MRLAICRHGEREDHCSVEWGELYGYDPMLTDKGLWQAKKLGEWLSAIDFQARILCSPFSRTIQTASEFQHNRKSKYSMDPRLSEWLNSSWFKYNPSHDFKMNYDLSNFPQYPETKSDLKNRTSYFMNDELKNKLDLIIVTHKPFIEAIGEKYNANLMNFDHCECAILTFSSRKMTSYKRVVPWKK